MLGLGLRVQGALGALPALVGGVLPVLPHGWAFVTWDGNHLTLAGAFLIVEVL